MRLKPVFLGLLALLVLSLAGAPLAAKDKEEREERRARPSGYLTIHATQFAVGLGYTWGDGTLRYRGKSYKFKVKGLNLIGVGLSSIDAKGEVYNLDNLDDFPGKYMGFGEGAALVMGKAGLVMKNFQGVVINLHAEQTGVDLKVGNEGLSITPAWK